jgi:DNA polymerase kappa
MRKQASEMTSEAQPQAEQQLDPESEKQIDTPSADHASLKYSLLGPSLTKAGQASVDQSKACLSPTPFGANPG